MSARVSDLQYVGLAVDDIAAERAFFAHTWGLVEVGEQDGKIYLAAEGSPHPFVIRLRQDPEKKTDLIGSTNMAQLLTAARQTYNYVIVDLPPLAPVIDAKAIAGAVDGFVFVIEWGETSMATVSDALHNAPHVNQKIIGCLLNKADEDTLHLYTSTVGNRQYYSNEKFGSYVSQS